MIIFEKDTTVSREPSKLHNIGWNMAGSVKFKMNRQKVHWTLWNHFMAFLDIAVIVPATGHGIGWQDSCLLSTEASTYLSLILDVVVAYGT